MVAMFWQNAAMDGDPESTEWATLGARILEVATMASAIHLMECMDASHGEQITVLDADQNEGESSMGLSPNVFS